MGSRETTVLRLWTAQLIGSAGLARPTQQKKTGSLIIWLENKLSADWLIQNGTALFGASGSFCTKYERFYDDKPCYNCNTYGHMQSHCKKATRCGICSGGHRTRECTNRANPKCPACTRPHAVFDLRCVLHPQHVKSNAGKEPSPRPAPAIPIPTSALKVFGPELPPGFTRS